ncbi:MAG: sigma-54-dependent Fis family transcriptional regulator [Pseudomonadota bacterium]|nr:sigma-54-dependent Fis family transcriptional regulator [Pseudomonadota bacterium]
MLTGAESTKPCALVVDDEADIRELLELTLLRMGLKADGAGTIAEAREFLSARNYAICLTDMRLPDGSGLDLVRHLSRQYPDTPVAVITAHGSMENAISALKEGAFDYLAKPVKLDHLRSLIKTALNLPATSGLMAERDLLGESVSIKHARTLIDRVARSQAPVHVTGESGSGKELAARLIHFQGARRDKPFIAVNCGAIPENLMESEFFGYRKGAFTGAENDRDGFYQVANGGTLFLDEVADLPLSMQVKLLRVIQEKRVRKVGATQEEPVDVRIISATNQKLSECVERRLFRQDLYYRLNVIEIRMPSLREMPEDIPMLANRLLERLAAQSAVVPPKLTSGALGALCRYDFPGNVRELENILERALALSSGEIVDIEDLHLFTEDELPQHFVPGSKWPLQPYLDQVERDALLAALECTGQNKTAAARLLGITFRSLRYRLERLGLD